MSNGTFSVKSWSKTYTVTVGASTTYDFGPGLRATAADVASGESVMVGGSVSGTDVTANRVHIRLPGVRGQVTAVAGSDITVQAPDGRQAVVDISGIANPPSLADGQQIAAVGKWSDGALPNVADTLDAQAVAVVPAHLFGVVQSSTGAPGSSGSATVLTRSGQNATVEWTGTTTFKSGPKGPAPTSLAKGQLIVAQGSGGSPFAATQIDVLPPPPANGPGGGGWQGHPHGHGGPQGGGGGAGAGSPSSGS